MLLDIILARWRRPVASSKAVDLLHLAMCAVTYQHIAMATKMASFFGVFVDCCLFACCPGSRWGNTEQVVAQCQRPVNSGAALDMLHWAMCFISHRRTAMAIKTASNGRTYCAISLLLNLEAARQGCCFQMNKSYRSKVVKRGLLRKPNLIL
jgi:hypothetical protein